MKPAGATIGTSRADNPVHPAEMVDVGVGVDHRGHRPVAAVRAVQAEGGRGRLLRDQRVDHDDALVALHQGHVRQIQTPDLVDALGDLVEAVAQELALTPQARMGGVRALAGRKASTSLSQTTGARVVADLHWFHAGDEAPVGVLEIGPIVEISWHGALLRAGRSCTEIVQDPTRGGKWPWTLQGGAGRRGPSDFRP